MKKFATVSLIILAFFILSFVFTKRYISIKNANLSNSANNLIPVTASFYPLTFFSAQVGGDKVRVTNLTPAGSEPHDYDPSPQQVAQIQNSKLLVLNVGGLEVWSEHLLQSLPPKQPLVVITGEQFDSLNEETDEMLEHTGEAIEEEHEHIQDPHIWLDPILAQQQVQKILIGYQQIDPVNTQTYQQNAAQLTKQLQELDTEFKQGLQQCTQTNLVTAHTAFYYLAKRYGLHQVAISGLSPDEEPSPAKLAQVADFVQQNQIKYIFFESLISPKLSQTIANETGAQTLVLNPLEGLTTEELQSGKDYFSVMRDNLNSLRIALECQ